MPWSGCLSNAGKPCGLGLAALCPWDLAASGAPSWQLLDQAWAFIQPEQPLVSIPGGVVPLTTRVDYAGAQSQQLRLQLVLPSGSLVEAWDSPTSTDPVRWEVTVDGSGSRTFTAWLRLPADASSLSGSAVLSYYNGTIWVDLPAQAITVIPGAGTPAAQLAAVITALDQVIPTTTDHGERDTLTGVKENLQHLIGAPAVTRNDAECALGVLTQAFKDMDGLTTPAEAAIQLEIARLILVWEGIWTTGSGS